MNKLETQSMSRAAVLFGHYRQMLPGVAIPAVVALAARFIQEQTGIPDMLAALFMGIALHITVDHRQSGDGVGFAARSILRLGIVLLGARITLDQIVGLGPGSVAVVVAALVATIVSGTVLSRWLGLGTSFGTLTGGATAICGASAALALAAVLPRHGRLERDTSVTVLGVTALSTVAMVVYPLLATWLGFNAAEAGLFLGATIHDVAQVVGAGYSMSVEIGDQATLTKLLRVALLLPAVMAVSLAYGAGRRGSKQPLVPAFLVGFLCLMALNSWLGLDENLRNVLIEVSRWCLLTAVAAIGIKTSFGSVLTIGPRAIGLLLGETIFLALVVTVLIFVAR